jgi:hypothetical protein
VQRLIDNKLIYGSLLEVDSPTLRARYNRALEILCGRQSALQSFRIDQAGFSPEIAEELGDPEYLNPHGCNRRFILLTLEQAGLPELGATFSTSRSILSRFCADNREALFALTARDAVYGELEDSVYRIDALEDLLAIKRIRVEVNTTRKLVTKARELAERIAAFAADDDAWSDETLLAEIIELAEATGDIRHQPVIPTRLDYQQGNFFTSHFGGLYVFLGAGTPTLVCQDAKLAKRGKKKTKTAPGRVALADGPGLADFLAREGLAEKLTEAAGVNARRLLKRKLDFMVVDQVARSDPRVALERAGPEDMKRYVYQHLDQLPPAFHQVAAVVKALEQGTAPPEFEPGEPGYFYLLRAAGHDDRDLVNHLLAQLTPLDLRQLFICNKALFYELYADWPEAKRAYVAHYLSRHYLGNRKGVREALFGPDPAHPKRTGRRRSRIPDSGPDASER